MSAADVAPWNRECVICAHKWQGDDTNNCPACIERVEDMLEQNGLDRNWGTERPAGQRMTETPIMCSGLRRVGATIGTHCPNRASTIVDGAALCGVHAKLAADGKLQVRDKAIEKFERKITAVKDALFDFLADVRVNMPDRSIELMAKDIVMTLENTK